MLLSQYWYYSSKKPIALPHGPSRIRATSTTTRRKSVERPSSHYRSLSVAAANVAANAAIAAHLDPQESRARLSRRTTDQSAELSQSMHLPRESEENIDDADLAAMADSFHSEGGRGTGRRKLVSWSAERQGSGRAERLPPTSTMHPSLQITANLDRGRSRQREGEADEEATDHPGTARTSSRASRRGASLVFLGVWALFGVGTLVGKRELMTSSTSIGQVLTDRLPSNDYHLWAALSGDVGEPSTQRILGRFFAWFCTTLYLTSRLPQIWKNVRVFYFSLGAITDGLSSILGNRLRVWRYPSLYLPSLAISSTLHPSSPRQICVKRLQSERLIYAKVFRESIYTLTDTPLTHNYSYLLGSGGTLMFDITIVCQSFVYKSKPKRRGRQGSSWVATIHEEEAGLLNDDALAASEAPSNT